MTPLFSELAHTVKPVVTAEQQPLKKRDFLTFLRKAPSSNQFQLLIEHLQESVAEILGLAPSQRPAPDQLLNELGLDSLMGVELRNHILYELGVSTPIGMLIDRSSINKLAEFLLEQSSLDELLSLENSPTTLSDDVEDITL